MSSGYTPEVAAVLGDQRRAAVLVLALLRGDQPGMLDALTAGLEAGRCTELLIETARVAVKLSGDDAEQRLTEHLMLLAETEARGDV